MRVMSAAIPVATMTTKTAAETTVQDKLVLELALEVLR